MRGLFFFLLFLANLSLNPSIQKEDLLGFSVSPQQRVYLVPLLILDTFYVAQHSEQSCGRGRAKVCITFSLSCPEYTSVLLLKVGRRYTSI